MEIYLDNAATTRTDPSAIQVMRQVMDLDYGNPSSLHQKGIDAEAYVKQARKIIAKTLKAEEREIIFTSGGTESNNLALFGTAYAKKRRGKHIITSSVEHASIYNPCIFLEQNGYEVTYLPVDKNGRVSVEDCVNAIRPDTILISLMLVNNEIGAIEPVAAIAKEAHKINPEIVVHVDAIQGYGKVPICPKRDGIDLLSVSGHKIHGPKGSGFLYVRDKLKLQPTILGGGQQTGMRSGTENVPAIAGLGEAVRVYFDQVEKKREHLYACKEQLIRRLQEIDGVQVNAIFAEEDAPLAERIRKTAPHIVSVSFDGILRSEVLLHKLEESGIYVSSGSACSSNHPAISGTLKAIGLQEAYLSATLRFSFGLQTTIEEMNAAADCLTTILPELRKLSR